jgi:hypothetical protein
MRCLRRMLGPVATVWLLCQAAGLTSAPLIVWITSPAHVDECTCGHGAHAMCPMHHRPSETECSMRAADDKSTAILSSLLPGVGVLARSTASIVPGPTLTILRLDVVVASLRPPAPDPPPPRV